MPELTESEYLRRLELDRLRGAIRKGLKKTGRAPSRDGGRGRIDEDVDASPSMERVMPVGERGRRRGNEARARSLLEEDAGPDSAPSAAAAEPGPDEPAKAQAGLHGLVVEVSQGLCRVQAGEIVLLCTVRGAVTSLSSGYTNVVAVGDKVIVTPTGGESGVVESVLPRRGALARPDVFRAHLHQVIVANADQLLAVAAWRDPAIWLELLDRYLITAERFGLRPLICVNKTDLAAESGTCRAELAPYEALGYRVIYASAANGDGVDELHLALRGQTTVLAGLSGVGKSSLLSAIEPGLHLRIGAVADYHIGRHTTTQVRMFPLSSGGYVVDTPGIREFGLSGLSRRDLAAFYHEIAAVAGGCRFRDCLHVGEAGCAVPQALAAGTVSAARYKNYRKILHSLPV